MSIILEISKSLGVHRNMLESDFLKTPQGTIAKRPNENILDIEKLLDRRQLSIH